MTSTRHKRTLTLLAAPLALAVAPATAFLIYDEPSTPSPPSAGAHVPATIAALTASAALAPKMAGPSSPPAAAPSASSGQNALDEEATIRTLRGFDDSDARSLLAWADQHAQRFPRGRHTEEREAIAIRALFRLDRISEARARAHAFLTDHPDGPFAERVAALSGVHVAR